MTPEEIRKLPEKFSKKTRSHSEDFESDLAFALLVELVAQFATFNQILVNLGSAAILKDNQKV